MKQKPSDRFDAMPRSRVIRFAVMAACFGIILVLAFFGSMNSIPDFPVRR